ncbi:hypothetical protein DXG01_007349 [Tephrocybe rancida]|nr:hypothetical protein DXG01_007349 [Tephrocybe rancida]
MRVLHTNGFHDVSLSYCGCWPLPPHIQLLRQDLYPTSQLVVKTCTTFDLLHHLHILSLTTKSSTYNFYQTLEKLTNNTGLNTPTMHYKALQRMRHQWRHLVMLKCGGRGHDPSGADRTAEGELAVPCPTCLHDGKNMAYGWRESSKLCLSTLSVAMDANLCLKQQLVLSHSQDPGFGTGLSYMVQQEPYNAYILNKLLKEM